MATISEKFGTGGANLTPAKSSARDTSTNPSLALALRDIADDLAEIRTKFIATLTQLDTEGGLGGGYVTANSPDALKTIKG